MIYILQHDAILHKNVSQKFWLHIKNQFYKSGSNGIFFFCQTFIHKSLWNLCSMIFYQTLEKVKRCINQAWLRTSMWLTMNSYTPRTLRACCSQSKFRILKIRESSVHYFCTIALRTYRAVLMRAWASRSVDLRERRVSLFFKRVIIFFGNI